MALPARARIGGYTVQRFVREGATGELYVARRVGAPSLTPEVAVKVIAPALVPTPKAWRALEDDLRRAARIDDPRVVRIEETGEDGGSRFVAMECVRGFSLGDILAFYLDRGRRMKPAHAVHVAMQAALGLQAAFETRDEQGHALRIVHGAVSPSTILVSWRGHVKLVRFGFAALTEATPDVFSLAAVLWSLLTGILELDLAKMGTPSEHAPDVPAALDEPIVRALDPVREGRPNALAFYRALAAALPEATQVTPSDLAAELGAIRLDREFGAFAKDRPIVGASFVPPKPTEPPSGSGPDVVVLVPRSEDAGRIAASLAATMAGAASASASASRGLREAEDANASERQTVRAPPPDSRPAAASGASDASDASRPGRSPRGLSSRTVTGIAAFAAGIIATTLLGVVSRARSEAAEGADAGRELAAPGQFMTPPLLGVPLTSSSAARAVASAAATNANANASADRAAGSSTNASTNANGRTGASASDAASATEKRDADASAPDAARARADAGASAAAVASGAPVASGAASARARAGSEETAFDRATSRALSGDMEGARAALESRVAAGSADRDEVLLLRAICRQQRDVECLQRLGGGQAAAPK